MNADEHNDDKPCLPMFQKSIVESLIKLRTCWEETGSNQFVRLYCYEQTDSTMNVAKRLARNQDVLCNPISVYNNSVSSNVRDLSVIVARSQTKGRGRKAREWISNRDVGLYINFLFSVKSNVELNGFSLAVAVAMQDAIRKLGGDIGFKWPNDLVRFHKNEQLSKLGGILVELIQNNSEEIYVSTGIGLNIKACDYRTTLKALSLEDIIGSIPEYCVVVAQVIDAFVCMCNEYFSLGFHAFRDRWQDGCVILGRKVKAEHNNNEVFGEVVGISENGGLLLRVFEEQSHVVELLSGDISLIVCE